MPSCTPISCTPMGGGQYCGVDRQRLRRHASIAAPAPTAWPAAGADHVCPSTAPDRARNLQCQLDKCTARHRQRHDDQRHGLRPGRARTRSTTSLLYVPNTALDPDPDGRVLRQLRLADLRHAGRGGADRRRRALHDQERAVGDQHPAGHPDRQVAAADHPADGHACQDNAFTDPNRPPAAQQDRGPHAADRAVDGRTPTRSTACCARSASPTREFTHRHAAAAACTCTWAAPASPATRARRAGRRARRSPTRTGRCSPATPKMRGYDIIVLQCEGEQLDNDEDARTSPT